MRNNNKIKVYVAFGVLIVLLSASIFFFVKQTVFAEPPHIIHTVNLADATSKYYVGSNALYWETSRIGDSQSVVFDNIDFDKVYQITLSLDAKPSVDDNGYLYYILNPVCTSQPRPDSSYAYREDCVGLERGGVGYVQGDSPPVYRGLSTSIGLDGFDTIAFYNTVDRGVTHTLRNIKLEVFEEVECVVDNDCNSVRACDVLRYVCVDIPPANGSDGNNTGGNETLPPPVDPIGFVKGNALSIIIVSIVILIMVVSVSFLFSKKKKKKGKKR